MGVNSRLVTVFLWVYDGQNENGREGPAMLAQSFFQQDTLTVARELLGKYLIRRYDGLTLAGRITET